MKLCKKEDSVPSAGTNADSEQKVENIFASSNDTKPNVVGLPSLSHKMSTLKEQIKNDQQILNCIAIDDYVSANERIQEIKAAYGIQTFVDGSSVQRQSRLVV